MMGSLEENKENEQLNTGQKLKLITKNLQVRKSERIRMGDFHHKALKMGAQYKMKTAMNAVLSS